MIVKKMFSRCAGAREWSQEGWYLFGILPLYVRDMQTRKRVGRSR